jgi:uncharacterized protein YkwD
MKKILLFFISLSSMVSFSQSWTPVQLNAANTAKDISYLSDVEKDIIKYINLARLYPKLFVQNEVNNSNGDKKNSKYQKSLIKELNTRQPVNALQFDKSMYELATCFASEIGKSGAVTHKRKSCPYGYLGECCSFGMGTGKDVAMQWLIDDGVSGVGHRVNCLNGEYAAIGIAVHEHKVYRTCAVADFR